MSNKLPKQNMLIVDDIPANIKVLAETLKSDYEISFATNGQQALEIARSKNPPDLILLDIMMPGMDGYDVCRTLKADKVTQSIPVIFITAKSEEEDETKGLEIGAVDYITKPFCPAIVKVRVRTHLERKQAEEERVKREKLQGVLETAGAVCHELNQPMQAVFGCLDLLLMDITEDNPLYEDLKEIKGQIARMGEITNKLMKITRYKTRDYIEGRKMLDINGASSRS